jgi:hypothetical protein
MSWQEIQQNKVGREGRANLVPLAVGAATVEHPGVVVAQVDHQLRGPHAGATLREGECALAVRHQPRLVCGSGAARSRMRGPSRERRMGDAASHRRSGKRALTLEEVRRPLFVHRRVTADASLHDLDVPGLGAVEHLEKPRVVEEAVLDQLERALARSLRVGRPIDGSSGCGGAAQGMRVARAARGGRAHRSYAGSRDRRPVRADPHREVPERVAGVFSQRKLHEEGARVWRRLWRGRGRLAGDQRATVLRRVCVRGCPGTGA